MRVLGPADQTPAVVFGRQLQTQLAQRSISAVKNLLRFKNFIDLNVEKHANEMQIYRFLRSPHEDAVLPPGDRGRRSRSERLAGQFVLFVGRHGLPAAQYPHLQRSYCQREFNENKIQIKFK